MKHPRISLSTALLLIVIAALTAGFVRSRVRVADLEHEIHSRSPMLRELDIAAQVEAATAAAGHPAVVKSLAHSPSGPTYLVAYAYHDPTTGNQQTSTFLLTYDGDGKYVGYLRSGPYLRGAPDMNGERGMRIVVRDEVAAAVLSPDE